VKVVQLRSKEVNKEIGDYGVSVKKKDTLERVDDRFLLINKEVAFFYHESTLLPTLKFLQTHNILKHITVDMGAVKFVIKGADIMRPGISSIDPGIEEGEYVVIIDENNKKPLAVGKALEDAATMQAMDKGKVITNIHYVGDEIWNFH
jgi:PUA-domain protein